MPSIHERGSTRLSFVHQPYLMPVPCVLSPMLAVAANLPRRQELQRPHVPLLSALGCGWRTSLRPESGVLLLGQ